MITVYTHISIGDRRVNMYPSHGPEDAAHLLVCPHVQIFWPSHILVYVQWANRSGRVGQYNSAFFDQVRRACHQGHLGFVQAIPLVKDNTHKPMSYLTRQWVFMNVREYLKPYHKRTWTTNSTKLSESGWAAFTTDQIHSLKQNKKGCKLVVQIQHFGGTDSAFFKNGQVRKLGLRWKK